MTLGMKVPGRPTGTSGPWRLYEMCLQRSGRAGERRLAEPRFGLSRNLDGFPHGNACAITIVGRYDA
jgi:acetyl-CoA C-acetyltransferase